MIWYVCETCGNTWSRYDDEPTDYICPYSDCEGAAIPYKACRDCDDHEPVKIGHKYAAPMRYEGLCLKCLLERADIYGMEYLREQINDTKQPDIAEDFAYWLGKKGYR